MQNLRQWCDDSGLEVATVPDLPRAVRQLSGEPWDVVLAVLDDTADTDLTWWADALRAAPGPPRLIVATQGPSMGLVLRAEKLGVLDVLSLPLRRDSFLNAIQRVRSAAGEVPIPLPDPERHAVGSLRAGWQGGQLESTSLWRASAPARPRFDPGRVGHRQRGRSRALHLDGPSIRTIRRGELRCDP